jgi:hypothetical protein
MIYGLDREGGKGEEIDINIAGRFVRVNAWVTCESRENEGKKQQAGTPDNPIRETKAVLFALSEPPE